MTCSTHGNGEASAHAGPGTRSGHRHQAHRGDEHLFLFVSFVNRFLPRFIRTYNYTVLMKDLRRRIKRQKSIL